MDLMTELTLESPQMSEAVLAGHGLLVAAPCAASSVVEALGSLPASSTLRPAEAFGYYKPDLRV